jgi:hypothetical protein
MKVVVMLMLLSCVGATTVVAASKDVTIHFDPSRIAKEARGEATQLMYNGPEIRYVEHERGAPVLPCREVHVVVPKNASYKSCKVRAASQRMRGLHKFYCREDNPRIRNSARRFPPKLAEFVGVNTIGGYRVFTFRAYPVMCQPGDGSASYVLRATLHIEYETTDGSGEYPPAKAGQLAEVKRAVINPDDVDRLTRSAAGGSGFDGGARDQGMFATRIRDRRSTGDGYSHAGNGEGESGLVAFIKDNLYISEDNDIVYAPIEF